MAKLAIFDLDGTLIDTVRMTGQAFRALCHRYALSVPSDAAIRGAMGLHEPAFYRTLFPDAPKDALMRLSVEVERREGEIGAALGPGILFPGVATMLEQLSNRGVTLCLASTGSRKHVLDMLNCARIRDCFAAFRCDEPDKRRMTGELLSLFGAGHAAYVGDTLIDVAAARGNGIPVFGAGFGYVKPGERGLFDAVADTPGQLTALLLGGQGS